MTDTAGDREGLIAAFLAAAGWQAARREPLARDASFRRYDRLFRDGETAVLMDAPPPTENVAAFHKVALILRGLGLSAPEPYAVDEDAGLMLLEDLGDQTFTRVLNGGGDAAALYRTATDLLIALHRRYQVSDAGDDVLSPYDDSRLLGEAALFTDWYMPAVLDASTPPEVRTAYIEGWRAALAAARAVPDSLVLRDYHVDNLMVVAGRDGVSACGLLDFQDAVIGPITYDLVSLLEDARHDVSAALASEMIDRYLSAFPGLDRAAFAASYAVLGAQRSAKIIGIFTRLCRRDGKPVYLKHIPRVWRWLEGDLEHPALAEMRDWFARAVPVDRRVTPRAEGSA